MQRCFTVFVAGICLIGSGLVVGCFPGPTPEEQAKRAAEDAVWKAEERQMQANTMAQGFVKDKLKSPYTAHFAEFNKKDVTNLGNNTFKVVSSVESENASGAMIQTYFVAIVHDNGDKTWSLKKLDLKRRD